ncbi:DUF3631 domain-containing protein [Luminiphilus sp.]|nr:DUF3631 domain-containing protein [Luminiphilus sp.]
MSNGTPLCPADLIVALLNKYCVMSDEEADAIALWIIASHLINDFRLFPKLALISPEKRCGKTTTLEVIQSVVKNGIQASNVSPAALYRFAGNQKPTILIDEADTFVGGNSELVGLLNSSHTKSGATVLRTVGDNYETRAFSTWMAMVMASIGALPGTVTDRSIVINLRRKRKGEFRHKLPNDLSSEGDPISASVDTWLQSKGPSIIAANPTVPDLRNDRAEDNWQPLFAVAESSSTDWLIRCESAAKTLTKPAELELPTLLLESIRRIFDDNKLRQIASVELVNQLCLETDGPWSECNNARAITPSFVAKLLKPYGICPKVLRLGDVTKRGYMLSDLQDAFERYLDDVA